MPKNQLSNEYTKMYTHSTKLRVRYSETDQMGYVYYGNYAQFFEIGRVEMLRSLGISYRQMEEQGIMLPVVNFEVKYIRPAYYDDLITIKTSITKIPTAKIVFDYELYNENNQLLTKANTVLVFVNKSTMKPTTAPQHLVNKLSELLANN